MPRRSTLWLASGAAALGALVVTAGVLVAQRTESDHDAIRPDGISGFVAPRPASTGAAPNPTTSIDEATRQASPLAMRLKDDGEGPSAAWPPGFHPTPERPTPLTMCLKHDTVDGTPICPNAQLQAGRPSALTMPLR